MSPFLTKAFWQSFEIEVNETVYDPSEDSFLLANQMVDCLGKSFLDMGCGSGIQSLAAAQKGALSITLVDQNKVALDNARSNIQRYFPKVSIDLIQSNLFEKVGKKEFDVICFNPPYVPTEGSPDIRLDGGLKGRDFLDLFLEQAPNYLNPNGVILFLQTSINDEEETIKKYQKDFDLIKIKSQNLFFESLSVWEMRKKK